LSDGLTFNPASTLALCENLYGTGRESKDEVEDCVYQTIEKITEKSRQAGFEAKHHWSNYKEQLLEEMQKAAKEANDGSAQLDLLNEKSESEAIEQVKEEFEQFNIEAVKELREQGIYSREKNSVLEIIVYYGLFIIMWLALYTPGIYDVVLFIVYALNDFGSAFDVYIDDHLSGWTIWVCT